MRVLLVEDDEALGLGVCRALQAQGWQVDLVRDGVAAQAAGVAESYGVAVLDLGLPRRDGMDVLEHWRSHGVQCPVLLLTARDTLHDRVLGLNAGADDYLVKPFDTPELIARLRALARRASGRVREALQVGDLALDTVTRELSCRGERLMLSPRELSLTELLMSRAGRVVAKEHIVSAMSSWESDFSENSVEVYVSRLRRRLAAASVEIKTVRGFGYVMEAASSTAVSQGTGDAPPAAAPAD